MIVVWNKEEKRDKRDVSSKPFGVLEHQRKTTWTPSTEYRVLNKPLWGARELIHEVMWRTHTTQAELARRVETSAQNIHATCGRQSGYTDKDVMVSNLSKALRVMGYILIAVPINFKPGDPMFCLDYRDGFNRSKAQKKGGTKDCEKDDNVSKSC